MTESKKLKPAPWRKVPPRSAPRAGFWLARRRPRS